MNPKVKEIVNAFEKKGNANYGDESVTQLAHALQCAHLAEKEGVEDSLILAALLHDIGHILSHEHMPESLEENLHDFHERIGYEWVKTIFGDKVAGPIRLHVAAKRYLCTKDSSYETQLSPTSYKSYLDQGGRMSKEELLEFEQDPFWKESLKLREWDDKAKVPSWIVPPIEHYLPIMEGLVL